MSWNYRVMKHVGAPDGTNDWFAIHEVYYDNNGNVASWTVDEIAPISDHEGGLLEIIDLMRGCLNKPTLELNEAGELVKRESER